MRGDRRCSKLANELRSEAEIWGSLRGVRNIWGTCFEPKYMYTVNKQRNCPLSKLVRRCLITQLTGADV